MAQFCTLSYDDLLYLDEIVMKYTRNRNFDILAAVFTEVLDYMHDDLGINDSNTR